MNLRRLVIMLIAVAVMLPLIALVAPKSQAFDLFGRACTDKTKNSPVCKDNQAARQGDDTTNNTIIRIIRTAANLIASIAAIGAVLIIMLGGYKFITAGGTPVGQRSGDPNKAKEARSSIVSALVGLVVIALAWTLIRFITDVVLK